MIPEYDLRNSLLMLRTKIQLRFCNKDGEFSSMPTENRDKKIEKVTQTSDSKRMFNSFITERIKERNSTIFSSRFLYRSNTYVQN